MNIDNPKHGDLKVWWIPQVPGKAFEMPVNNLREAKLLLAVLGRYDQFQHENRIRPDYCNAGGLVQFYDGNNSDCPDGEWADWYNEDGYGIDDVDDDGNLIEE